MMIFESSTEPLVDADTDQETVFNLISNVKDRAVLIVMVGVPGSGKSTWIKRMLGNDVYKQHVVSSDAHLEEMAARERISYHEAFNQYYKDAQRMMNEDYNELKKRNKLIVWDQTNLSKKKRRSITSQTPNHYIRVAVELQKTRYTIDTNLETRYQTQGKYIPPTVIDDMWQTHTPIDETEDFDFIIKQRGQE